MCGNNTKERCRPTGKRSGQISWLGGSRYVVQPCTALNLSRRTKSTSIACRSRGEASRGTKPNVNSFQFACLLSLAIMLVFAGFLPPTSPRAHDTSDKLSAQGGRFASGGEAASFQVLGISCVAYPALAQLPTCLAPRAGASSCFDATRGFPGEGPKTNSPERNDGNFTSESAAAGTNADQRHNTDVQWK